jgi:hypothetical protein
VINSSTYNGSETLARVPASRVEEFVRELANLQVGLKSWERFFAKFGAFFPEDYLLNSKWAQIAKERGKSDEADVRSYSLMMLDTFASQLRRAWDEPDSRKRDWHVYELRRAFQMGMNDSSPHAAPPEYTPFEQAMVYFHKVADRAKHCPNPDCPAPYFIAKKRSFKYCSEACSEPAQRLYKQTWWEKHGDAWRKRRTKKKGAKRAKK